MSETSMTRLPDGFWDVFQVATLPSTHRGAFVERGGKAIKATTEQGFLCFGQYREKYPQQPLQAVFSILIDNHTADDRYILFVDVYDHHSDRVIGKRLISRKDFPAANTFCLFTFDFTPPSAQARMEFRIFYLGYAYICADKIAIIDPARVQIRDASQLPQIEVTPATPVLPQPQPQPQLQQPEPDVNIRPWQLARLGQGSATISAYQITKHKIDTGKSEFLFQGALTIQATGGSQGCTDVVFPYVEWMSQFGFARIWAAYFSPEAQGFVGVMIRESLDPAAKFILLEGQRVLYRATTGGAITEKILTDPHFPKEVRIDRQGHHANQSFDLLVITKKNREIKDSIPLNLADHLYAGPVIGTFCGTFEMCTKYKDHAAIYTPQDAQC